MCNLCSGKHRLHNMTDLVTLLFTLDLNWNSSYLSKHMESIIERTENVFWLEVIREGLKLSHKEMVESAWQEKCLQGIELYTWQLSSTN